MAVKAGEDGVGVRLGGAVSVTTEEDPTDPFSTLTLLDGVCTLRSRGEDGGLVEGGVTRSWLSLFGLVNKERELELLVLDKVSKSEVEGGECDPCAGWK